MQPIETKISVTPGIVIVNNAYISFSGRSEATAVACIQVDLATKNAEIDGVSDTDDSAPVIFLGKGEHTIKHDPSGKTSTAIAFDDFPGFEVFSITIARYTAYVTLLKRDREAE